MPFLLLLILTLICIQGKWPNPLGWNSPLVVSAVTWGSMAVLVIAAGLVALRASRRLHQDPDQRGLLLRHYGKLRRYHGYTLITVFIATLYLGGWGWAVKHIASLIPGVELLILTPFLGGLVLSWALFYNIELAAHETNPLPHDSGLFIGRWTYVLLQLRQNLLLVFPPLLLLLIQQTVFWAFPSLQDSTVFLPIFAVALLAAIFIGIPFVLRLLLGLKPLPEGPLRERLLATSRRLRFRCNDILLWNTRNAMANAMVTGPLPILRYVVLTDRLVRDMTPDEVEAVFGHEMGHVKHHHMLFYFGFLVGSLVVLAGAWEGLRLFVDTYLASRVPQVNDWLQNSEFLGLLPMVALLATYVFVVFGFLSRRCERQADIYGCRAVSPQTFIEALEKVARLNGISRDRPGWLSSWQHSTIARRVEFLQNMCVDPALEPRFQRRVRFIKWSMVFTLVSVIAAVYTLLGGETVMNILARL
jgi:Zn-dependent protease with chaperone function